MSYRLGDREEGDEELFDTASSVSSGDSASDDEEGDQFPSGGAGAAGGEGSCDQDRCRRASVPQPQPQPLRRMNTDSIYDMASMMSQLPAKKGLSRYYEGKSQSFACMSEVRCLDDLRKKDSPYKQKAKSSCKSYVALGGVAKKPSSSSSGSCAGLGLAAANGFRTPPIQNGYQYHQ